jgi:hypothetical protein
MSPRKTAQKVAFARAAVALMLIWAIATGSIFLARSMRPTASDVIAYLRQQDLTKISPEDRPRAIRDAASRLNRLEFEQIRQVQQNRALFLFYRPLSPPEKETFAALIVPTGLRRILDASLKLPRQQRAEFLERAVYHAVLDLTIAEPPIDPAALERIERDALRDYVEDLSLADRFELEPQLRQLRQYLQPAG